MAGDQEAVKGKEVVEDQPPVAAEEHEEPANANAEEEDTGAQIAPIIRLEEVAVSTGEENEEALIDMKAKLYRFDTSGNQWKERGVGVVKILKHKETKKVRLLMRQNKTLKICANHYLSGTTSLQEHAGSDKSWVWHALDYSDGEMKEETLCIRLGSVENAQTFKSIFDEATENAAAQSDENEEQAEEAATLLGTLKVDKDVKNNEAVQESAGGKE